MAENPVAALTTQKGSAALGAVLAGAFIAPRLARFSPLVRVGIGAGAIWAGSSMLDGHAESLVVGIGVGIMAQGLLSMFLTVPGPSE